MDYRKLTDTGSEKITVTTNASMPSIERGAKTSTPGSSVSTVRVRVLSASLASLLKLPAASLKASSPTEITPLAVLFASGVKTTL